MTKKEVVAEICMKTGIGRQEAMQVVEAWMECVKDALSSGEEVFLRGFGSFIIKHRAAKTARNISQNTTVTVPAHDIPAFKPAKEFLRMMKK